MRRESISSMNRCRFDTIMIYGPFYVNHKAGLIPEGTPILP